MTQTIQGVILAVEDSGDFDQKVTVYSREFGKFRAKVAGVKKTISKLRSLVQPFAESSLHIYLHGTARAGVNDPGKLIGGETLNPHSGLRSDMDRMVQAHMFCETLDALTKTFYPNADEYQLLLDTLSALEKTTRPELVRMRSVLILLKILGYSLRHHPVWKSMSAADRSLLLRLGTWALEDNHFTDEEVKILKNLTQSYLLLYLNMPLKSEIFMRKVEALAI